MLQWYKRIFHLKHLWKAGEKENRPNPFMLTRNITSLLDVHKISAKKGSNFISWLQRWRTFPDRYQYIKDEEEWRKISEKDQSGIFTGRRKVEISFVGRANNDAWEAIRKAFRLTLKPYFLGSSLFLIKFMTSMKLDGKIFPDSQL